MRAARTHCAIDLPGDAADPPLPLFDERLASPSKQGKTR